MDEVPGISVGSRRNEDIALDLMKFIAMTTGYGRTSGSPGESVPGRRSSYEAGRICRTSARSLWKMFECGWEE
jgi:hypothetical protein